MDKKKEKKLTLEDGKRALHDHVREKAVEIQTKYGLPFTLESLKQLLRDPDFVRFPAAMEFDTSKLAEGQFACALPIDEDNPGKGYVIYIHEFFKAKEDTIPAVVLYHFVTINYGNFSDFTAAEIFASTVLGLDQDKYYDWICQLTDSIPK